MATEMIANAFSQLPSADPLTKALEAVAAQRTIGFYRRSFIEEALAWAWPIYLPYPAQRVKQEFWETPDGQAFANVEWVLYSEEAITQSKAAEILECSVSNVWRLTLKLGVLRLYRKPDYLLTNFKINPRTGQATRPYYMRESEVLAYKDRSR